MPKKRTPSNRSSSKFTPKSGGSAPKSGGRKKPSATKNSRRQSGKTTSGSPAGKESGRPNRGGSGSRRSSGSSLRSSGGSKDSTGSNSGPRNSGPGTKGVRSGHKPPGGSPKRGGATSKRSGSGSKPSGSGSKGKTASGPVHPGSGRDRTGSGTKKRTSKKQSGTSDRARPQGKSARGTKSASDQNRRPNSKPSSSSRRPSSPARMNSGTSGSRGATPKPTQSTRSSSPRNAAPHPGKPRTNPQRDGVSKRTKPNRSGTGAKRKQAPKITLEPKGPPRLQKVLAEAGIGSRRECETLIEEGRVEIDRNVVVELGVRVDPDKQEVRLDGEVITIARRLYFAVNKPTGVVSTNSDPDGRMRVVDLIGGDQRLFTVGRLDKSSEGLIIVTNDGELAQQLTHPKFGVEKKYLVQVQGHPAPHHLSKLTQGVRLAEGVAKAKSIKVKKRLRNATELEMVLEEGRNREIRRLLARVGHKVTRLKRIAIGPFKLGELPTGHVYRLSQQDVKELRRAIGIQHAPRKAKP